MEGGTRSFRGATLPRQLTPSHLGQPGCSVGSYRKRGYSYPAQIEQKLYLGRAGASPPLVLPCCIWAGQENPLLLPRARGLPGDPICPEDTGGRSQRLRQEARRCYGACCPPGPPPPPVRAWSGVPTIFWEFLVAAGHLCHGEEGIRDVREEGVQVEVLPTPRLLFLIPQQHGHHIAEKLVAPFLCWLPDILILHEMERRSQVGTSCASSPCLAPQLLSKASHLAPWCLQKGESAHPKGLTSHPFGFVTPWGFHPPSSQAAQCRVCIASPFPLLPTLPRLTCFGLESSPSRVDLRSWKERTAWVTPQAGRAGCGAEPGAGEKRAVLRSGVTGGLSVAPTSSHLPLLHRVWAEQLLQRWDRRCVVVRGCQRPARPWHPWLYRS